MFFCFGTFAQQVSDTTAAFKNKKLKVEEVNLVTSFYQQNGDNAAVTGGIGSQKLTDFSNVIDVKLTRYSKLNNKQNLTIGTGVDYYSSASSDQVDLQANSSASYTDLRVYPTINWEVENEKKGNTYSVNASTSFEFDYQSFGFSINGSKKSKDKNRQLDVNLSTYQDQIKLILPIELRPFTPNVRTSYSYAGRKTYSSSMVVSQVVNQKLQLAFMLDLVYQTGFLSLPFHRVYLNNNFVKAELLPTTRFKLPVGIRANYFAGDKLVLRSYYRYYIDDWGLKSHTVNLETAIKITPFFSISPFYRFYNQTAIKYFAAYKQHTPQEAFYTSNFDFSNFTSHFLGAGIRTVPLKGVLGNKHFNALELRYGHYIKSYGMNANIISTNLKFK